jgi:hypothetical protein
LPLFVTGGGSQAPVVRTIIKRADQMARSHWDPYKGLELRTLPVPPTVAPHGGVSPDEFVRLSVAYGLSFPKLDIGDVEPPGDVPDVPVVRTSRDWRQAYVDKDQV